MREVEQRVVAPASSDAVSLLERMAHYAVPGVALALIADSEIAVEAGYGMKEAGARRSGDPATRFQACSISKPVAVLGMLRLVEQGVARSRRRRQRRAHVVARPAERLVAAARDAAPDRESQRGSHGGRVPRLRPRSAAAHADGDPHRLGPREHGGHPGRHAARRRVPLRRRGHDGAAAGARGRHRPPVRRADARARPRAARHDAQRLHATAPRRAARRGGDRARDGRRRRWRAGGTSTRSSRPRALDDARRPRALRHRGAARGRRRSDGDPRAGAHGVDADPAFRPRLAAWRASTPSVSACFSAAPGSGTAAATRASGATWSRTARRDAGLR